MAPTWETDDGAVKLWRGDCREILAMLPALESVVVDPPYGMGFQSNHRTDRYERIIGDTELGVFLFCCSLPVSHSRYVFCRWDELRIAPQPRSCITWVKNNWGMGDLAHEHARQTESILFWPGDSHNWPDGRPPDVIDGRRTGNVYHPTEKPLEVMQKVVGWTLGTVADVCMGSGTTGVACIRLGRPFIGIELDPGYFDDAVSRVKAALKEDREQPMLFEMKTPPSKQPTLF